MQRRIEPPRTPPQRWTQDPLPPYRYVPGEGPHPLRDPRGHRYPLFVPENRVHLGYDLINYRFYWEAHELLEGRWKECRGTMEAEWLQSLIQACAHILRLHTGHEQASHRLLTRSLNRLRDVRIYDASVLDVHLDSWEEGLCAYQDGGDPPVLRAVIRDSAV